MVESAPAKGNILGSLVPARYILAILSSIGMAIIYGLKVNLSVALVAMLNHTAIGADDIEIADNGNQSECEAGVTETLEDGPFTWNEPLQGTILSCYFWGYFISQIPGGRISELISAKWVMFFGVAINTICTLLTPISADSNYGLVILMRILEGIGGGVTFPAMHVMLASWAPPSELGTISSITYAGTALGTVISMYMAGELAAAFGWASVFYIMGGLSSIWLLLWIWLIQDTPNKQTLISIEEREFITAQIGAHKTDGIEKLPIPWKSVLTSSSFIAIAIAHMCSNWGWYMLLIEVPFYMKQIQKFSMREIASFTALPFLTLWIFSIILSKTLDTLRSNGKLTATAARKIATLFASVIPAICLIGMCFVGCDKGAAIAFMTIAITSVGGMFSGYLSNHIDIAPNFAGTLMALTNTLATLPGIIVPIFIGYITHGNKTEGAWRSIFLTAVVFYIIEIIVYTIWASGEEQPWNKPSRKNETEKCEETPLNVQNPK